MFNRQAFTSIVSEIQTREEVRMAYDIMKAHNDMLISRVAYTFRPGEKASFLSKHGRIIVGTIEKVNPKNIKLNCGENGRWTVSANLLTKVEN